MSQTGTFTAVGVSGDIIPTIKGFMTVNVTNGVGSVILEDSPDGVRTVWKTASVASNEILKTGVTVVEVKPGQVFRLRCTAYTSGTILYNVSVPEDVSAIAPQDPVGHIGGRFAAIGDSISANMGIDTGTAVPPAAGLRTQSPQGYLTWVSYLSRQRVNIEAGANFSLSGRTSADMTTQIYNVIRYRPTWCIVESGTNDPGNVLTLAQTIANLTQIYQALTAAGIRILAIPVTPRTTPNAYTTAQNQTLAATNRFIRDYARTHGNIVIADPRLGGYMNFATGAPAAGVTQDGLHPNQKGAYIWGNQIWTALSPFVQATPDADPVLVDPLDLYDSVANPTGNMLTNGMFQTTTGGTLTGNSLLTGSVPGSWTAIMTKADAAYTGTIAITNTTHPTLPGSMFRLTAASLVGTVTGGAQDHVQLFQQVNFPAGLQPGDVVEAMAEIRVNATAGFNGFDVNLGYSDGNGVTSFATFMGPATNSSAWQQGTYNGIAKSPRTVIGPANGASQRVIQGFVNVYFDTTPGTGTATAVIDVGSISVRKVASV